MRDGCADLVCFGSVVALARSRSAGAHHGARLRPGGRWAGWWSHARADGEPWFDAYFDFEAAVPGVGRNRRDIDWGADVRASRLFDVGDCLRFPWERVVESKRGCSTIGAAATLPACPRPNAND